MVAMTAMERSGENVFITNCRSRGWEITPSPTRIGTPNQNKIHDLSRMMLFVSEKGRQGRKDFEGQPVYVDEAW
jgi:hypothetical protein